MRDWMLSCGSAPYASQERVWDAVAVLCNGVLCAPLGAVRSQTLALASLIQYMDDPMAEEHHTGLHLLWLTPEREQAEIIAHLVQDLADAFDIRWTVAVRCGDSFSPVHRRQRSRSPHILIATPENLHVVFAMGGYRSLFASVRCVVLDSWQELQGTKRGVQTELALAHIRTMAPNALLWACVQSPDCAESARDALLAVQTRTTVVVDAWDELSAEPAMGNVFEDSPAVAEPEEPVQLSAVPLELPVAMDVLAQYCKTRACGEGYTPDELYNEVVAAPAYARLARTEFDRLLDVLTRVQIAPGCVQPCRLQLRNGVYRSADSAAALQHKLSLTTALNDTAESELYGPERYIARVDAGGVTPLSLWGTAVPVLPRSAVLYRRERIACGDDNAAGIDIAVQQQVSALPRSNELLIEAITTSEGHHLFLYTWEGRILHRGLAVLFAHRVTRLYPAVVWVAVGEYGIELLSDVRLSPHRLLAQDVFTDYNLEDDLPRVDTRDAVFARFCRIVRNARLLPESTPEQEHQQMHALFSSIEHDNPLLRQACDEVLLLQPTVEDMRAALNRLWKYELLVTHPHALTPLARAVQEP